MQELSYNIDIRSFRIHNNECIHVNGKFIFLSYHAIHDYYPIKHFGRDVDNSIQLVRSLIYNFKDGNNSNQVSSLIYDAIVSSSIEYNNSCFVVIPASNQEKTNIRFLPFCNQLCSKLNIINGFNGISTLPHEHQKGQYGGDKIQYFSFNHSIYENKNVLLFDDITTSGTVFKQTAKKLIETGAKSITGIFLGKTVSHL